MSIIHYTFCGTLSQIDAHKEDSAETEERINENSLLD